MLDINESRDFLSAEDQLFKSKGYTFGSGTVPYYHRVLVGKSIFGEVEIRVVFLVHTAVSHLLCNFDLTFTARSHNEDSMRELYIQSKIPLKCNKIIQNSLLNKMKSAFFIPLYETNVEYEASGQDMAQLKVRFQRIGILGEVFSNVERLTEQIFLKLKAGDSKFTWKVERTGKPMKVKPKMLKLAR